MRKRGDKGQGDYGTGKGHRGEVPSHRRGLEECKVIMVEKSTKIVHLLFRRVDGRGFMEFIPGKSLQFWDRNLGAMPGLQELFFQLRPGVMVWAKLESSRSKPGTFVAYIDGLIDREPHGEGVVDKVEEVDAAAEAEDAPGRRESAPDGQPPSPAAVVPERSAAASEVLRGGRSDPELPAKASQKPGSGRFLEGAVHAPEFVPGAHLLDKSAVNQLPAQLEEDLPGPSPKVVIAYHGQVEAISGVQQREKCQAIQMVCDADEPKPEEHLAPDLDCKRIKKTSSVGSTDVMKTIDEELYEDADESGDIVVECRSVLKTVSTAKVGPAGTADFGHFSTSAVVVRDVSKGEVSTDNFPLKTAPPLVVKHSGADVEVPLSENLPTIRSPRLPKLSQVDCKIPVETTTEEPVAETTTERDLKELELEEGRGFLNMLEALNSGNNIGDDDDLIEMEAAASTSEGPPSVDVTVEEAIWEKMMANKAVSDNFLMASALAGGTEGVGDDLVTGGIVDMPVDASPEDDRSMKISSNAVVEDGVFTKATAMGVSPIPPACRRTASSGANTNSEAVLKACIFSLRRLLKDEVDKFLDQVEREVSLQFP